MGIFLQRGMAVPNLKQGEQQKCIRFRVGVKFFRDDSGNQKEVSSFHSGPRPSVLACHLWGSAPNSSVLYH